MHPRDTTSLWLDRDIEPQRDILPADGRFDDLVIGGGLTGLTTALLLARAGRRVGVIEARHVGSMTTGRTTGKVSLLQGTKLSRILERQPKDVAAAYVEANREGMEWLLRFCDDHEVPYQRRDAVTYAASAGELSSVRAEDEAARALGLPVTWSDQLDVPFPSYGATSLPDQAQLNSMDLLDALMRQLRLHEGTVHEGNRVVSISKLGKPAGVRLDDGRELTAEHVILATGTPIADRGFHFAQLEPKRSYALAFQDAPAMTGMYLSAGSSARSIRDAPTEKGQHLVVGGAGHVVGRASSTEKRFEELRAWTEKYFPGAKETHAWSAQDYAPYDAVPIVGRLALSHGRIFVATGFDKWGMTNGVAAAHTIVAEILGGKGPGLRAHPLRPEPLLEAARINLAVAAEMVIGHAKCRSSRVCTHLGGPLTWNEAEQSWDCRLHGSRFTADGTVLEGPATKPLRR